METELNQYRDKLKLNNRITGIGCLVLSGFCLFATLNESGILHIVPVTGNDHWNSMWNGFLCGAATGVLLLMIFFLVRSIRALSDEKKLRELYIKEHDERQIQIWTAARALSTQIFLIGGLAAGVVAGYFNITVSITILACVVVHSFLALGCKIYYSTKY